MLPRPTKSVTFLLPQELYDGLKESARQDCRSLSAQIRQILKAYLQSQEKEKTI